MTLVVFLSLLNEQLKRSLETMETQLQKAFRAPNFAFIRLTNLSSIRQLLKLQVSASSIPISLSFTSLPPFLRRISGADQPRCWVHGYFLVRKVRGFGDEQLVSPKSLSTCLLIFGCHGPSCSAARTS